MLKIKWPPFFYAWKKETLVEWTMLFDTTELFETVVKVFKADEGLKQNVEKLMAYIQTPLKQGNVITKIKRMSKINNNKKQLSSEQREELLSTLKVRFEKNRNRHQGIEWAKVQSRLSGIEANSEKLWSLNEMERTGGEPDVVGYDKKTDEYIFYDCAAESPKGRRSVCYDRKAWEARKEHKPANNAIDMAAAMGIELLTEQQYRELQSRRISGENFDMKTSSWIITPSAIRQLGGALFADYRYGTVFVYHNGAESYYAARGFRGSLRA